jgi:peptide/nickel transport system substrate-binding protein
VWVANPDVGTVTRIDAAERAVTNTVPVGEDPTSLAVGDGAVWVVESGGPSVSRISQETEAVVDTIPVGNGPVDVAVGANSVWVTNRFDGTVSRIDPVNGEVVETIPVGSDPEGVAVGAGSIWVSLAGSNAVVRIDPATDSVVQSIGVGSSPGPLEATGEAVWVVNTLDDTVSSIDPDAGRVTSVAPVGDGPAGIAALGSDVWVANEADGSLSAIGAATRTLRVGSTPHGLAAVGGDLWVSVQGTATSHRGGTLRLVSSPGPNTMDPAAAYHSTSWLLFHTIGDGLVAFKAVGGADGATLVPDLATSLPTATQGGKTYTFQLRGGIEYSNGEVVVPTDVRRAFERGFAIPSTAGDYAYFFGEIAGAPACVKEPETCDLSEGIATDDASRTIAFHLDRPDPEFLFKLSLPFAYPVPASVQNAEQREAGVPGTGPYMLEGPMTEEGLTLVRNPRFRVWSAAAQPEGYVDRIEWTFGVERGVQAETVAARRADVALDGPPPEKLERYLVNYAGQVHSNSVPVTFFVTLNTRTPPFDDVDARRALNFALDRAEVVALMGGDTAAGTTCQQLPPNFPGYQPYCPYTIDPGPQGVWTSPDLEAAHRLVRRSGTEGMRVTLWYSPSFGPPVRPVREALEELGYGVRVRSIADAGSYFRYIEDSGNEVQMAISVWVADYTAASNFFTPLLTCDSFVPNNPNNQNTSGFCDPETDAIIDRATRVQVEDPVAAGALWADVDRTIVDQAPYLWLVNSTDIEFVSERLGNYQLSPQWGLLVNQVWVR